MQVFKSYKVGSIVWWKNINSLSKDINQAKRFVGKPGILFEVDYISGRDILSFLFFFHFFFSSPSSSSFDVLVH